MKPAPKAMESPELINPYGDNRNKAAQVEEMFDNIAPAYDFMNTAMSFGLHRHWRNRALRAAVEALGTASPAAILDIATGTGDLAFHLAQAYPRAAVTAIDLSEGMLAQAQRKLETMPPDLQRRITFSRADSLRLPFAAGSFDLITVAYGVRNFENLRAGYNEMNRTLRPGGLLCVIELSQPASKPALAAYRLYARHLIPLAGRMVSGDSRAYSYLPESIAAAPQRDSMARLLEEAGFQQVSWKSLTFGAVTYYLARKN